MKVTFGIEFQTSNFNIMIKKKDDNTVYYPRTRLNIDISSADTYPIIQMTGDTLTSETIRNYSGFYSQTQSPLHNYYQKWRRLTAVNLQLSLELQRQQDRQQKIKIPIQDNITEIFNDAEFLVTFNISEEWQLDRVSILNGIITKLKTGAFELERTLMLKTIKLKIATLKLMTAQNAQIRPLQSQEFPYKAGYSLKNDKEKTFYLLSHEKQMTLQRAHFYSQITMCVSLENIVKVMAILTDECRRCAEHLNPDDAEQLKIFPEIITRLADKVGIQAIKDNPIVYTILVLFIYSFYTKANRKAAPFIIRHVMVFLLNLLEQPQLLMLSEWVVLYDDAEFIQYTKKIFDQFAKQTGILQLLDFQDLMDCSVFKIQDKMICFEFRYLYALLEKWSGGDRLLTFAQLKGLPQIGTRGRPSLVPLTQTFI